MTMWNKFLIDRDDYIAPNRCFVAAAILGAGAVSAGASMWGASTAADAQTRNSQAALAQQRQMFGEAKNALSPFINAGKEGIGNLTDWLNPNNTGGPLAALLKLVMPGANMSETLAQTPGYQFTEDRGLRGVNNALAARGLAGSGGAVAKGAGDYVTGLANNTWQSVVDKLLQTFAGGAGSLQGLVNTGANAGGNLAGGAISSGNAQAGTQIGIGNAQGGAATAIGNAVGQGANSLSTAALIQQLTNKTAAPASTSGLYGVDSSVPDPWAGVR